MTELEIARQSERIGADRLEAFCRLAPRSSAVAYGLRWRRVGGLVQLACDHVSELSRNRTQGLGLDEPLTAETLDDVIAFHRAGGVKEFMLRVAPGAEPADHESLLRARDLTWWRRRLVWVRDCAPCPPVRCEFEVREVEPHDALVYARHTVAAHGSPSHFIAWAEAMVREGVYRAFMAWQGDEAVASASMSIGPHGAWLGGAMTRREFRGRGAQAALLAARLQAAHEARAGLVIVETIEPQSDAEGISPRNVERAGFRVAMRPPSWVPVTPEDGASEEARQG